MDDIQATGEPVVVTKRGVGREGCASGGKKRSLRVYGGPNGIVGDIESPVVPLKQWKVFKK
jgi:hypothetical protein